MAELSGKLEKGDRLVLTAVNVHAVSSVVTGIFLQVSALN